MTQNRERYLTQALSFEPALRDYLRSCVRNSSDVEDLLQETYARLLRAGDTRKLVVQSIRAFAFTVARNAVVDFTRIHPGQVLAIPMDSMTEADELQVSNSLTVEGTVNAQQEINLLAQAMKGLPKRCRQVFTLRKVYGYSQAEIAAQMGISENTVESHIGLAARRCATYLCNRRGRPQQYALLEHFRQGARRKRF